MKTKTIKEVENWIEDTHNKYYDYFSTENKNVDKDEAIKIFIDASGSLEEIEGVTTELWSDMNDKLCQFIGIIVMFWNTDVVDQLEVGAELYGVLQNYQNNQYWH